jgi:predicted ATPase
VAYGSLLKSRRQQLHARVGSVLQERFHDTIVKQPELLAHHFSEAGLTEEAISWWRQAGEQARERSANLEAIAHLTRGLALLDGLPDETRRAEQEFDFQLALGGPLTLIKGYAAPEVERTHLRARELGERLDKSGELFPVLRGLWHCYFLRGQLRRVVELAERLIAVADQDGEPFRRATARRALGSTLFYFGRFSESCEWLEEGIALDDTAVMGDQRARILLHTEQPGIICRLYLAWAKWLLGYPDSAMVHIETALTQSRKLSHAYSVTFALTFAALVHILRREFDQARRQADAAIAVAREHSFAQYVAFGTICRGFALVHLGEHEDGLATLDAGIAGWRDTGSVLIDTMWFALRAEALVAAGQNEAASVALDRGAEVATTNDETFYASELARLRGEIRLRQAHNAKAQRWLHRSLDLARRQGARSLELRAATSLARLWRDQGRCAEAQALLAPIYGWFTEGLDTADLSQARTLLAELGERLERDARAHHA